MDSLVDSLGTWGFFAYVLIGYIIILLVMVNVVERLLENTYLKYKVPRWILCVAPALVATKCFCLLLGIPLLLYPGPIMTFLLISLLAQSES
ncbi:hypothetical protein C0030_006090 [Candidatus Liberibacter solanacearum]|uniref:Uncharacterized protein n=1 Tax=Candidatus Liberibacter solanacearum TaxID=556287 RepID=A0A424FKS0_9HYPH|nr:hypothetical protein C0030_006090 [Candidatus Liberibacter solanacearum]